MTLMLLPYLAGESLQLALDRRRRRLRRPRLPFPQAQLSPRPSPRCPTNTARALPGPWAA